MGKKSVIISTGISIALFASAVAVSLVNNKNTNEKIDKNYDVADEQSKNVQDSVTALGKTLESTKQEITKKIEDEVRTTLGTVEGKENALTEMIAEAVADATLKATEANADTLAKLNAAKAALEDAIAGSKADLADAVEDIKSLANDNVVVAATVNGLLSKLEGVDVNVMTEIDADYIELNGKIAEVIASLNTKEAELKASIVKAGSDTAAEFVKVRSELANTKSELEDLIDLAQNDASAALTKIGELKTKLEAKDSELAASLAQLAINYNTKDIELAGEIEKLQAKLVGIDASVLEDVSTLVNGLQGQINDINEDELPKITALQEALAEVQETLALKADSNTVAAKFATIKQLLDFNGDDAVTKKMAALDAYNDHYNLMKNRFEGYVADILAQYPNEDAEQTDPEYAAKHAKYLAYLVYKGSADAAREELVNLSEQDKMNIYLSSLDEDGNLVTSFGREEMDVNELAAREEGVDELIEKWHITQAKETAFDEVRKYADRYLGYIESRIPHYLDCGEYADAINGIAIKFTAATVKDCKTVDEVKIEVDKAKYYILRNYYKANVLDSKLEVIEYLTDNNPYNGSNPKEAPYASDRFADLSNEENGVSTNNQADYVQLVESTYNKFAWDVEWSIFEDTTDLDQYFSDANAKIYAIRELAHVQLAEYNAYHAWMETYITESADKEKGLWRKLRIKIATVGEPYMTIKECEDAVAMYRSIMNASGYDYSDTKGKTKAEIADLYETEKAAIAAAIKVYTDAYRLVYIQDVKNDEFFALKNEILDYIENDNLLFGLSEYGDDPDPEKIKSYPGELSTAQKTALVKEIDAIKVSPDTTEKENTVEDFENAWRAADTKLKAIRQKIINNHMEKILIENAIKTFGSVKVEDDLQQLDVYGDGTVFAPFNSFMSQEEREKLIKDSTDNLFRKIDNCDEYNWLKPTTDTDTAEDLKDKYNNVATLAVDSEVEEVNKVIAVFTEQARALYWNQQVKNYVQQVAPYTFEVAKNEGIEVNGVKYDCTVDSNEIDKDVRNAYVARLSEAFNNQVVILKSGKKITVSGFTSDTTLDDAKEAFKIFKANYTDVIEKEYKDYLKAIAERNQSLEVLKTYVAEKKHETYGYNGLTAAEVTAFTKKITDDDNNRELVMTWLELSPAGTKSGVNYESVLEQFLTDVRKVLKEAKDLYDAHQYGYLHNELMYAQINEHFDSHIDGDTVLLGTKPSIKEEYKNRYVAESDENRISTIESNKRPYAVDGNHETVNGNAYANWIAQAENKGVQWTGDENHNGKIDESEKAGYVEMIDAIYTDHMADQLATKAAVDAEYTKFLGGINAWKAAIFSHYKSLDEAHRIASTKAYLLELDFFWEDLTSTFVERNIGNKLQAELYEIYSNGKTAISSVGNTYDVAAKYQEVLDAIKAKLPKKPA